MMQLNYSGLIQWLLHSLGATENYAGFFPTVYAVQLSIRDPERLGLITKMIYPDVAGRYGTNWKAVERNIRTLVSVDAVRAGGLPPEKEAHQRAVFINPDRLLRPDHPLTEAVHHTLYLAGVAASARYFLL